MTIWRAQHYRQIGVREGTDPHILDRAIQYGNAITRADRGLTPIFTLRHLSVLSGVGYHELRAYAARSEDADEIPYRLFRIRKRTGPSGKPRLRTICVPCAPLRKVQRFIHEKVLIRLPAHPASIAYKRDLNLVDEVAIHCGCRWLIKMDIRNFFEAISERAAYKVFRQAGYPALVSFEMARLCTRIVPPNRSEGPFGQSDAERSRYSNEGYPWRRLGTLPQGAPSSPILANLCARKLDDLIANIADDSGMVYTRYSDDITLSTSSVDFSRRDAQIVIQKVYAAMRRCDFSPNTAKTLVVPPGARKVVLGLYVDQATPRLSREFRTRLEQHLFFCLHDDVGPVAHARHRKFSAVLGFKNHLRGLIAYATQIEPPYGAARLAEFQQISWPL